MLVFSEAMFSANPLYLDNGVQGVAFDSIEVDLKVRDLV